MRKLVLLVLVMAIGAPVMAFERTDTLIGNRSIDNGVFAAPVIRFSQLDNKWGLMVGGRLGWVINKTLVIGGGAYQLIDNGIKADILNMQGDRLDYKLNYGGLELALVADSDDLFHYTLSALLGTGSVSFGGTSAGQDSDQSNFYVFEPGATIVMNVTQNFRASLGAYYRLTTAVDSPYFTNEKVNGPSIELAFNLGFF